MAGVSGFRRQALIDGPVERVWELVGDPLRHPEWWPRIVEVRGESFAVGDSFAQVTRGPVLSQNMQIRIEERDDPRELALRCPVSGTFSHWKLTEVQDGTFVDVELGMDPITRRDRLFDATAGRLFFRRWLDDTVDALKAAVERPDG